MFTFLHLETDYHPGQVHKCTLTSKGRFYYCADNGSDKTGKILPDLSLAIYTVIDPSSFVNQAHYFQLIWGKTLILIENEYMGLTQCYRCIISVNIGNKKNKLQGLAKVFGPLEIFDLLPHFRLQT